MVSTGSVAHSELFSSQVNLNSFDDYDLDAIPLHIVRTESFQGMPGHEDLVDSFRGMAAYTQPGETLVDYSEANDYSFDFANEVYIPKPQLSKQSNNVKATTEKGVFHLEKGFPDNSKVVGIPEPKPFLLMKTHWTVTDSTVSRIECKIKNCLKGMPDVSVNPNPVKCQWEMWAMQCQGNSSCKMQVAIYSTADQGAHIVECNRLSGDHGPFNEVYRALKAAFVVAAEHPSLRRQSTIRDSFASNMGPIPCQECVSDEEAKLALQPILAFASSKFVENQIEASKMLCDFSHDETLQQILCDEMTLRAILRLTQEDMPLCARRNAFMALANLSTQHGPCQEAIIEAGVLPVLLQLVSNGSYETAELRREGARALANLSTRLASEICNQVGEDSLKAWFGSIDALADERVKLHAMVARDSLKLVCA